MNKTEEHFGHIQKSLIKILSKILFCSILQNARSKLSFNKTTALPVNITIVCIGVAGGTGWFLQNIECPV